MSFILDALKKLEEKHQKKSVPDLMTIHAGGSSKQKKSPLLPYFLAALLIINALVIAALLRPNEKRDNALTGQALQRSSPAAMMVAPENKTAAIKNIKHGAQTPSNAETAPAGINPSPGELRALRSKIKEEHALIDSSPEPEQTEEHAFTDPVPAPRTIQEDETAPGTDMTVPDIGQVPLDIRNGLPDITINGHIYSNDPSSRLVNINGNIIREGDMVEQGLKVNEITMSGVVFNYRGLLFSIRAF